MVSEWGGGLVQVGVGGFGERSVAWEMAARKTERWLMGELMSGGCLAGM